MAKILVIDDELSFRESLMETLSDLGHEPLGAASVRAGLDKLSEFRPDAIFVDYRMPELDGLEAIRRLRADPKWAAIPVVMITAHFSSENTISAMKLGAFDYLTKPIGRKDVADVLAKLLPRRSAEPLENATPRVRSGRDTFVDAFVGASAEVRDVLKMIGKVAGTETAVLITGETGTGKELVARAIHKNSERAGKPLVAINCASIPENLLESELFGHVRGAFTGATSDRAGSFRSAEGGTLFLDEIGDMPLALQAKLLRTLQEKEVVPLGSSKPVKINVRFLAATHQDLAAMVAAKTFREDLYYRLNVIEINLPPLRLRKGDIQILANHFLEQLRTEDVAKRLSTDALAKLESHAWPGNVRELRNVIERAGVVSRTPIIDASDIRFLASRMESAEASDDLDLPTAVERLERRLILRALEAALGNRSEAARKLGIQRQLLYTKIKEYGIGV